MLKKKPAGALLLLSFILFGFTVNAKTYYVSSSGNDSNSGIDPSTPWQTLNKVNSFRSFASGDNILFNRGNTFYGSITISNSGTLGSPITFGAYGSGANPVITGFTNVTSWTSLGGNIWESSSAVSALSTCNMVAINGVNIPMGRYPNTGFLTYQSHNGNTSITSSSLTGSPNWTGASIAIKKERYVIETGKVTGQSGGTISFSDGKLYTPTDGFGFFIQNDPRTLDKQNEWYYNPSTGKVRVYSVSSPINVQIATIENVVAVSGTWSYNFNNISFKGSNSDAMNLHLVSSGNISVKNCDISYAGGDGIYADRVTVDIEDNNISNANSNGIEVTYTCPNSIIKNNTLKNIGIIPGMTRTVSAGSIFTMGDNALVQYNNIDSSGYNGIFFNGNNAKIRNNFINHSCLIKDDGAGVYTNGIKVGREISGNIILNTIGLIDGVGGSGNFLAHGIHLDGGTKYVTVSGNTVSGCRGTGLFIQQTTDAIIKGNTSYDNGVKGNWMKGEIMFQCTDTNPIQNVTLSDNIFFAKTMDQLAVFYYTSSTNLNDVKQLGTSNNNYYTRPLDEDKIIYVQAGSTSEYYNLSTWKSFAGQDANSKPSPKPINDIQDLRLEYNATQSSKTISLGAKYIDVKGVEYNGVITLPPYTSAVLTKDGAITSNNLLPAVNPSNTVNGLDYKYYEASSYSVLPSFSSLTPVKTGTVTNFDITQASRSTSYSFNYSGYINVPADGQYTFYTVSDDGSSLYIDNILVVNNDGLHGWTERSGVIGLQAGKHAISVGYFQQSGDQNLSVSYSGPGVSKQAIPASALYRVSGSNLLPAVNPSNTVNGLDYKYYEASSYSVLPSFSSLTPVKTGTVTNFDITQASRSTSYSFNYSGYINVPTDGQYTFYTVSDDGSSLYIDNILVVNNDGLHGWTERSGVIGLQAGKHAISVGYFQQSGDQNLSVSYSGPGVSKQAIPASALYRVSGSNLLPAVNPSNTVNGLDYKYYEASSYSVLPSFSSLTPVKTGTVTNFDITQASRSTSYSFNYSGYINVPADGQYTFYTVSDDGSSLYIDNILVVNNDGLHGWTERSGVIGLQAGKHAISVGYFQQSGDQNLSVSYSGPGVSKQAIPASALYRVSGSNLLPAVNPSNTVNGLDYKYYEASSYSVLPSFSSLTPVKTGTVTNFDITQASRSTSYSFNYSGYINVPTDGQYTFYTVSDDGSSLYIDNILVVNNDGLHGWTERSGVIGLQAGKHAISVGYFQQSGDQNLSVSYSGPGVSKQAIPASALYRVSGANSQRVMVSSSSAGMDSSAYSISNPLMNTPMVEPGIKAYPNPFNNSINISIGGILGGTSQLILLDATGKTIWKQDIDGGVSSYYKVLNTSSYANGIYFLEFIQNGKRSVIKLMKQR